MSLSKIELKDAVWINKTSSGKGLMLSFKKEDGTYINYIASVKAMQEYLDGSRKGFAFNDAKKALGEK